MMRKIIKWGLLFAAAVFTCQVHRKKKEKSGLNWNAYTKSLLGLSKAGEDRKAYFDELRCLASVLVILVHGMRAAAQRPEIAGSALWYGFVGGSGLGLCCNLLFVLISGALLIPYREEGIGTFYQKRLMKVAVPLAAYYIFYLHRSGLVSFSLSSLGYAVKQILTGPMELVPHFWLVYVFIQLYIGVPLLRWMVKNMPEAVLTKLAGLMVLGMGVKTGLSLGGITLGVSVSWFSWEGIFLLGYWLSIQQSSACDRAVYLGGGISGVVILLIQCFFPAWADAAVNDSLFMVLFSMAVFLFFLRRSPGQGRGRIWTQGINVISRYSFSILMVHWFMLFVVVENHLHIGPEMFGGSWMLFGVLLQSVLALLASLVFAVIYDNTVVLLAEQAVGILCRILGRCCRQKQKGGSGR